jgi:general secretion pathway protein M
MMKHWRSLFQDLPDKDRLRIQYVALALLISLLWFFNILPALQTYQQAPLQLAKLEQQSETLKALQLQAMALQKAPRIKAQDASAVLPQIMAGTLGSGAKLNLEATRATLQVTSISAEALAQFLEEARKQAHALPTEAHLQKIKTGTQDMWRGTLILNLPSQ